jgi:hypothetical protein
MIWQTIETAPKDGAHVLLLIPDYEYGGYSIHDKKPINVAIEGWWDIDIEEWRVAILPSHGCGCCAGSNDNPTHWMPIPGLH